MTTVQQFNMKLAPELWARFEVLAGYDCRARCCHDPPGDHGICSEQWVYSIGDSPEKRTTSCSVVLLVFSRRYPPTVPPTLQLASTMAVVSRHAFDPEGEPCEYLGGRGCRSNMSVLSSVAGDDMSFIDFDHPDPTERLWTGLLRWVDGWEDACAEAKVTRARQLLARYGLSKEAR